MDSKDIFTALAKYNSARDENYLTEAFVFVLNSILLRNNGIDRGIACELLNMLCVKDNQFSFNEVDSIIIETQEVTDEGTPDIKIFTPDKLIYIEVKHDSPLEKTQISRYKNVIEHSEATMRKVVLLTRFAVSIKNEEERPYKHVRWYDL